MTPPSAGAAGRRGAAPAGGDEPLLTIGELLARLSPEFPDVSHSKVRFLEDRGLVSPRRTPSGYRKFAPADVERLRVVLTLQRDQYLPLRVIREHLAARDAAGDAGHDLPLPEAPAGARPADGPSTRAEPRGAAPREPGASGHDEQRGQREPGEPSGVAAEPADPSARPSVSRAEVLHEAGGSLALVEALEDHGLLPRESAGHYPAPALDLVRAARVLADHGVEPRHLRALRSAVGHEAALVEQVVSPLRRQRTDDASGGHAQRVGGQLVASMLALHAAALGCAVDDVLPGA